MRKTLFISMQFHPVEGGVETFLLEVAKAWNHGDVEVWCRKHPNTPDEQKSPLFIKRFNWGFGTHKESSRSFIPFLCSAKHKLSYLKFACLLFINRVMIKNCMPFIFESFPDFANLYKENKNISIQCSMPIYTGVIGLFYKLIFDVPLVVYAHGSELIYHSRKKNQDLMQRYVLKKADLIISNSQYTTDLLVSKGADRNKIFKTLLGANTRMFFPKDTQAAIKERFDIPQEHKILLTVSHLVPRKGMDMVINALPDILKSVPNLTYLIGGRGEYLETLQKLVDKLNLHDHVKFLGFVKDQEINDIFNAADIFIMPNRIEDYDVEGFGIVFADAAACGKATIAGNTGGAVDAIVDRETGFLVDPTSCKDIIDKTVTLLKDDDLRNEMGRNGYERVQKELNWDAVRAKIYAQMQELEKK
ncbi:MAG TPA: glycosyltransferase family 4 protein [Candidatus Cloacimonadota bacterium]|nr:glycosyltransferase family 4 protein [Candidatus Cloacimonadota bacterium]